MRHPQTLALILLLVACNTGTGVKPPITKPTDNNDPCAAGTTTATCGSSNAHTVGRWSDVQPWPLVPIHATLLPDGKVLSWGGGDDTYLNRFDSPHNSNDTDLWDPASNTHTKIRNTFTELFCSGHALTADGKLLVAGGHWQDGWGKIDTNLFDYRTQTWSKGADMNAGRWYPTVAPLGTGDLLVAGGTKEDITGSETPTEKAAKFNQIPQIWQSSTTAQPDTNPSKWRNLTGAAQLTDYYSWLFAAPNGTVFNAGPNPYLTSFNLSGNGSVLEHGFDATLGKTFREYGSAVMYAPGKVLVVGGGSSNSPEADSSNPIASAVSVNLNSGKPVISGAGSMAFARRQHNATVLPDGTVLVTGGMNAPGKGEKAATGNNGSIVRAPLTPDQIIKPSELWNPATNTWSTLSSLSVPRLYHSVALLMPDARVLVGGGGRCGTQCSDYTNVEFFSPPYLFKRDGSGNLATRPSIQSAPDTVTLGSSFAVQSPDAATIGRVNLVRLGSVTHAWNMNQRFVELSFTRSGTTLNVSAPSNGNTAPPGHYMLFVLDANGVPGVAKIVRLTL